MSKFIDSRDRALSAVAGRFPMARQRLAL